MSEIDKLKQKCPGIRSFAERIGNSLAENYRKGLDGAYHNRLSKGIEVATKARPEQLTVIINQLLDDRVKNKAKTIVQISEGEMDKRALILGLWSCREVYIGRENKIQVKSSQIYRNENYIPRISINNLDNFNHQHQYQDEGYSQEKIKNIDGSSNQENPASKFDLDKIRDERKKLYRLIAERRGQPKFREDLKKAYSNRCAITNCDIQELLEAAHIVPYRGNYTNDIRNGILLRADIHTLFDIGLIGIDSASYQVVISDNLKKTEYEGISSKKLRLPSSPADYPSKEALDWHLKEYNL